MTSSTYSFLCGGTILFLIVKLNLINLNTWTLDICRTFSWFSLHVCIYIFFSCFLSLATCRNKDYYMLYIYIYIYIHIYTYIYIHIYIYIYIIYIYIYIYIYYIYIYIYIYILREEKTGAIFNGSKRTGSAMRRARIMTEHGCRKLSNRQI